MANKINTCRTQRAGNIKPAIPAMDRTTVLLQVVTISWMLAECLGSLIAAGRAHNITLLAFGSDSFIELLSAGTVLLQYTDHFRIDRRRASTIAGWLLFTLAGVVGVTAVVSLIRVVKSDDSTLGLVITSAALVIMPILARVKRTTALRTNDRALAADSVQSAMCAYLAAITIASLAVHRLYPARWLDPAAALCAIPILAVEGRRALQGRSCACC
jgi:hypothetical protein